jgi:hypothetical protein
MSQSLKASSTRDNKQIVEPACSDEQERQERFSWARRLIGSALYGVARVIRASRSARLRLNLLGVRAPD